MRANNHGEGGILALMTMTGARWAGHGRWLVIMGLFGAALIMEIVLTLEQYEDYDSEFQNQTKTLS
jgi:K+ transporter